MPYVKTKKKEREKRKEKKHKSKYLQKDKNTKDEEGEWCSITGNHLITRTNDYTRTKNRWDQ